MFSLVLYVVKMMLGAPIQQTVCLTQKISLQVSCRTEFPVRVCLSVGSYHPLSSVPDGDKPLLKRN